MEQKFVEIAFKTFLEEFIKVGKGLFAEGEKEFVHLLRINLKKYLTKYKNRFSSIKTILQGSAPVFLYDFYFPLRILEGKYVSRYHYGSELDNYSISTDSIKFLFNKSNYITIMGDAGSGKSTLVKHLFLNCISEKYAIPFLLELRYLNDFPGTIDEYIVSKIFETQIGESVSITERMLKNGKFVFFLDGYDEINSNVKEKIVKQLDEFTTRYPDNKFILTSRPYSDIEHFQKFANYAIARLNDLEIRNFIRKQLPKETELADKIVHSVTENRSHYIKSFLTNPLLLSLYILTYQSNAEIPQKKYIFYRRVIQALFSEHDSKTKIGYRRERKTELTQEQFEEILKRFSFLSFFEAKYDFEYDYVIDILKKIKDKLIETKFDNNKLIGDLKSALALWVEDNGIYGFAHRSMQEYYVANFIKRLDITNKKKIYQKLIERTHETLSSEIENLLSLSEEMDTFYFYSLYKIPLLEQLKKQLENPDSDRVLMNTVSHLVRIIDINFNDKRSNDYAFMHLNSEINRYLYFHLNYMKRLHTKLLPFREYISKGNTSKAKRFQYKIDPHDFPQDLLTYCKKNHFGDLCSEFIAWLDGEIRFAKDFIEKTSQSNDELVAMI